MKAPTALIDAGFLVGIPIYWITMGIFVFGVTWPLAIASAAILDVAWVWLRKT